MKTPAIKFVAFLTIVLLCLANPGNNVNLQANAQSHGQANCNFVLPSFLERGKTYNFTFAVSLGDYNSTATPPLTIVGKIEKLESQAGWLYINHYVTTRKGKTFESKFEGYSWINFNQVFQCSEMTINP